MCKIDIWSEELVDGYQTVLLPTNLGLSFGVVNCLVVFPRQRILILTIPF